MMELRVCHLYPDVLNLYGDRGNVLCIKKRLEWRGIGCTVTELPIGERRGLGNFDLFFVGGGLPCVLGVRLVPLGGGMGAYTRAAAEDGAAFLCVCGGYQLMGHHYDTVSGARCAGLDVLDLVTEGAEERMIGNFAFETEFGPVVGFENHSGRTRLGPGAQPLGRVLRGFGNNGEDGTEGARYKNVFGTYSHGPVLPKNPGFCDGILLAALRRRYGDAELSPLPDLSEREAHESVLAKLLG